MGDIMEYKVISDKKNELEFELGGEDHTFSNLLINKILENDDVVIAHYKLPHPLVGSPLFYVKTKKDTPKSVVKKALAELKKDLKALGR